MPWLAKILLFLLYLSYFKSDSDGVKISNVCYISVAMKNVNVSDIFNLKWDIHKYVSSTNPFCMIFWSQDINKSIWGF